MRIVVTGASGFVGGHVVGLLAKRGHEVVGVARRSVPMPERVELVRVADMAGDVDWAPILRGAGAVVHLAARVHRMQDTRDAHDAYFRENVQATERLARAAARASVRRFVFLSTAKVHGEDSGQGAFSERDTPHPSDSYAESKWEAEKTLQRVHTETALEVVTIRPPLVYGPGVGANFLSLMRHVERGMPLPLAQVSNRRSLVYVGNLAALVAECVEHPGAAGQTFLACDGPSVSTPELIRAIARALQRPARLWPLPPTLMQRVARAAGLEAQVRRLTGSFAVDGSHAQSVLGFNAPFSFEAGLAETSMWFRASSARARH